MKNAKIKNTICIKPEDGFISSFIKINTNDYYYMYQPTNSTNGNRVDKSKFNYFKCACGNHGVFHGFYNKDNFYCPKCGNRLFKNFGSEKSTQYRLWSNELLDNSTIYGIADAVVINDILKYNNMPIDPVVEYNSDTMHLNVRYTEFKLEFPENTREKYVQPVFIARLREYDGKLSEFRVPSLLKSKTASWPYGGNRYLSYIPKTVIESKYDKIYKELNPMYANNHHSEEIDYLANHPDELIQPYTHTLYESGYLKLLEKDRELLDLSKRKIHEILMIPRSIYNAIPMMTIIFENYAHATNRKTSEEIELYTHSSITTVQSIQKVLNNKDFQNNANMIYDVTNKDEMYKFLLGIKAIHPDLEWHQILTAFRYYCKFLGVLCSEVEKQITNNTGETANNMNTNYYVNHVNRKLDIYYMLLHNNKLIFKKYIDCVYRYNYKFESLNNYLINNYFLEDLGNFSGDTLYDFINTLTDYCNMMNQLGIRCDKYPKDLHRAHNNLSNMINAKEYAEYQNGEQAKHFTEIYGSYKALECEDKKSGYKLVLPESSNDIVQEGSNLKHCVATYVKKVLNDETLIAFVREIENPKESFFTVELSPVNLSVIQIRGKYNQAPPKSVVKFVQNAAMKTLKCKRQVQMT